MLVPDPERIRIENLQNMNSRGLQKLRVRTHPPHTFWTRLFAFAFVLTVFAGMNCAVIGLSVFYCPVLTRSQIFFSCDFADVMLSVFYSPVLTHSLMFLQL